jgi:hypothetical protein
MSVGDIIALVVAIVTAAGVMVALLTFLYSLVTKPSLHVSLGQEITMFYTFYKDLVVCSDFACLNQGAKPGALTQLSACLSSHNSNHKVKSFLWRTFEETLFEGGPGRQTKPWTRSTGIARTLIIPGRMSGNSGVTHGVRLYEVTSPAKDPLPPDTYYLTLSALEGSEHPKEYKSIYELVIPANALNDLNAYCCEDKHGMKDNRAVFQREQLSGKGQLARAKEYIWSGFLRRPQVIGKFEYQGLQNPRPVESPTNRTEPV